MAANAVSTWSLHRTLGSYVSGDSPSGHGGRLAPPVAGAVELLELPAELNRRGYDLLQICHFHLPTRDPGYLAELRAALAAADVGLDAILVDDGDLTHPTAADEHEAWIGGWLDTATELGARRGRVVAGQAPPTTERLAESGRRLGRLAREHPGIRVLTENWMALLPTAADVHAVLGPVEGEVGLLIDLGNWTGAGKYAELASVAPLAETCHAKCHFTADGADAVDFLKALRVLREADYEGPLALIYGGPDDHEWDGLEEERTIARTMFG